MTKRLLIRPGAIGDFIVSLPAMEALRADFTEVWCAEQNVPLARFADRACSIGSAGLNRLGVMDAGHCDDVIRRLAGFDDIVSWYGENRPDFRDLVAQMGLPFRFLRALPDGAGHAVDFYHGQADSLGAKPRGNPRILLNEADRDETSRTFAVIHPFASSNAKQASIETFRASADRLSRTMPVHWLCGPEEDLPGAVRMDNLYELACWLRGARIFVGNDSGISHLAAAVGTPVIAFFRASDPKVWSPRGSAVNIAHGGV